MLLNWNWLKKHRYRPLSNVSENDQQFFRHPRDINPNAIKSLGADEQKKLEVYMTAINSGQILSVEDWKSYNCLTLTMVLIQIGLN